MTFSQALEFAFGERDLGWSGVVSDPNLLPQNVVEFRERKLCFVLWFYFERNFAADGDKVSEGNPQAGNTHHSMFCRRSARQTLTDIEDDNV